MKSKTCTTQVKVHGNLHVSLCITHVKVRRNFGVRCCISMFHPASKGTWKFPCSFTCLKQNEGSEGDRAFCSLSSCQKVVQKKWQTGSDIFQLDLFCERNLNFFLQN